MNTYKIALNLSRPRTLIASVSPVLLASSLALKTDTFSFPLGILLLATALMLQILCNVANDYFDGISGVDHAGRVGPLRLTGSGKVSKKKIRQLLIAGFMITLTLGMILSIIGGALIASVIGASILLAVLYTAGPFPLSYKGLSEPFAFAFFGPIPTLFATYLFSHEWSFVSFILGCLAGCYSLIFITLNNLRDYESDSKTQKKTLVVRYGRSFGKKIIVWSLILLLLLPFTLLSSYPKLSFAIILLPEIIPFYRKLMSAETAQHFLPLFKSSGQLYLMHTLLWIGFILL